MSLSVLLVSPIREGGSVQIAPDAGILYLATALRNKGFRVTLLDCSREHMTFRDFKAFLETDPYDVVGFRCYSRDHNYVSHHLRIVRQTLPQALTLVGGPHPSALPEFVLNAMPDLDFAWKAEAEEGLPVLLSLFAVYGKKLPESELEKIPGLVWRNSGTGSPLVNAPGFSLDLDSIGMPAWELLQPDTYPGFIWDEYYPILTTRGCPYPCTYCNTPGLSGRKLRHRSVENVLAELRFLKSRYNIHRFSIIDDEFTLDRNYALQFCKALIEAGLDLRWDCPVGVRIDSLTPQLLRLMEAAGCEALAVGIETGNERIQKLIRKKLTVEKIREKAAEIHGVTRIKVWGFFMIGFLDETEDEIWDTINLAKSLPLVRANFNLVIPVPGTAIFQEALEKKKLSLEKINWDTCTCDQVSFQRNHVSGKRLVQLEKLAYLHFYCRPRILLQLAKSTLKNSEVVWSALKKIKALLRTSEVDPRIPLYARETDV